MKHKDWLNYEYQKWIEALEASTVHNFRENPMVKRMLGDIVWPIKHLPTIIDRERELITAIDNIGRTEPGSISGTGWRMTYYACQVMHRKPRAIIEIGGGVGEFYAIMRAIGYRGQYWIVDLPEVQRFQKKYLEKVTELTGLHTELELADRFDMCVSFYALGEFDDELKAYYIKHIVNECPRGFVIWNPHSGATADVPFKCEIKDEYPLLAEGNKQLEW